MIDWNALPAEMLAEQGRHRADLAITQARIPLAYDSHPEPSDHPAVEPHLIEWLDGFERAVFSETEEPRAVGLFVPNLIIYGPVGASKSTIAAVVLREALRLNARSINAQITGLWVNVPGLLTQFRDRYTANMSASEILDPLQRATLLVLDDIAIETSNRSGPDLHAHSAFYQVLNHRFEYGLPSIVSVTTHERDDANDMGRTLESRIGAPSASRLVGAARSGAPTAQIIGMKSSRGDLRQGG